MWNIALSILGQILSTVLNSSEHKTTVRVSPQLLDPINRLNYDLRKGVHFWSYSI